MTTCDRELCRFEDVLAASMAESRATLAAFGVPVTPLRRRTALTYVGRVLIHPYNLLFVGSALLLSFIGWSPLLLLLGLGAELVILCIVPWRGYVRQRIDAQLDECDRAAWSRAREAMIRQMDIRHQQELARLDRLIDRTRENIRRRGGAVPLLLDGDGDVGLNHLLTSYIRLAIAHKAGQESLAMTNHHELMDTIRSLEAVRSTSSGRTRGLSERRLSIAYRRAECWSRTREGLELVSQKLATILELIQLMHEQSMTPIDSPSTCTEIDRFMRELDDFDGGESTQRELEALDLERAFEFEELEAEHGQQGRPAMRLVAR
ncbi:hypothetical protein SOCE26_052040 [Sorangium cellulosum]|uniref:Uncharacterized protein n=2 Tax=Sorangium cellulosum TaxID=56 RepID=A0A2L0EWX3_SORCE|nr:hypothetical protein SOCE26_052040 [Sorangium cellulosum]